MADADNNNINPPAPEGTINNQSPPMEPLPPVDNNPVMAAAMPPPIDVKFGDVIPNSKPREVEQVTESYVYRDFASADPGQLEPGIAHKNMPPSALQSQKLPSKLAAMLQDPGELVFVVFRMMCTRLNFIHLLLNYNLFKTS